MPLTIGFFFLLGVIVFNYLQRQNYTEESLWIRRNVEIISQLQLLQSELTDAETGMRGFLATNDVIFLEPYHQALENVPVSFDSVQVLIEDNAKQAQNLIQLDLLSNDGVP